MPALTSEEIRSLPPGTMVFAGWPGGPMMESVAPVHEDAVVYLTRDDWMRDRPRPPALSARGDGGFGSTGER